jgi:hypothetical protein
MEYIIISNSELIELQIAVNKALVDGWRPAGGVACALSESDDYRYSLFCQALVRSPAESEPELMDSPKPPNKH